VARDYDLKSRRLRLQIELRQIMQHVDGSAGDLDDFRLRQSARPRILIDVPANSGDRRDASKFLKNLQRTNVAGMNDLFGPS
jgi:hypothetical protein